MQTLPLLPRSNSSRSGSWFQGEYWLWESVCGAATVAPAPHRAADVTVPEKPWLAQDSLSATRVLLVMRLQRMVP